MTRFLWLAAAVLLPCSLRAQEAQVTAEQALKLLKEGNARFARDMSESVGMGPHEQELAHTAGLLHDIGRFALSDRVAERGRTLTEEDWVAIQDSSAMLGALLAKFGRCSVPQLA